MFSLECLLPLPISFLPLFTTLDLSVLHQVTVSEASAVLLVPDGSLKTSTVFHV